MKDTTDNELLDRITIDLIFALRDSLTEVSRLDFWAGRVTTALETAAAGSSSWEQAVTTAAHKLQIETLSAAAAMKVVGLGDEVGRLNAFEQWCGHVSRNIVYIVALANVARDQHKKTTVKTTQEEVF